MISENSIVVIAKTKEWLQDWCPVACCGVFSSDAISRLAERGSV